MNVILLKDVEKLGLRGEVVNVARGYARNFLLPRQLAEVATEGRVKEVKRIDAQKAMHEARSAEQAAEIAATLGKTVLRFDVKSGPTGSLFGSVTTTDIADEIWRTRKIRVDRRKIGIDNIKRIGRYAVPVDVFEGVSAELKLMVVPEGRRAAARGGARGDGGSRGCGSSGGRRRRSRCGRRRARRRVGARRGRRGHGDGRAGARSSKVERACRARGRFGGLGSPAPAAPWAAGARNVPQPLWRAGQTFRSQRRFRGGQPAPGLGRSRPVWGI